VRLGEIRFGRLVAERAGYDGLNVVDQNTLDQLNAQVRAAFGRNPGGRQAPDWYTGNTTTWLDQRGWLYYAGDDKPAGNFTKKSHIPGKIDPTVPPP